MIDRVLSQQQLNLALLARQLLLRASVGDDVEGKRAALKEFHR